jgi:cyanate lyase
MTKAELSKTLLESKQKKGLTWAELSRSVGMSEVWLASLFYGESSATPEIADKLGELLDLSDPVKAALQRCPLKGSGVGENVVPTDPLIYRFYEIMAVYGLALKDVIHEKFGDGIMSAVDFTLDVDRQEDPKGDRVVVTMSGKFLPYKRW